METSNCYISTEWRKNITCLWKYKLLYSKCCGGCVYGRERWRTAMIDTTRRQTYSAHCFFPKRFDTEQVLNLEATWPPLGKGVFSLTALQFNWPYNSLRSKNFYIIYFLDAHTFFTSRSIQMIHFRCPLFITKTQVQYPAYEIQNNQLSKVNM